MRARIDRLKDLERMESSGAIAMRPKKEAAVLRRELDRLQKYLGGLKTMRRLPDVVVLVDQRRETNAVLECRKLDIPLVSMLDTNCDPDLCDVPIPCNDDAVRSVQLVLGRLADAINEGRSGSQDRGEEEG
jgi:small subunit ribosomal protein S2